ncbi:MAG: ArsR family transcriptional regulator [Candidatus Kariarchaeaceae archaeon]
MRILVLLAQKQELNISAISRQTGLNHSRVRLHLNDLCELNIVKEKRFGRISIFMINDSELGGHRIKDFLKSWANGSDLDELFFKRRMD